jgi:hypothetical protein
MIHTATPVEVKEVKEVASAEATPTHTLATLATHQEAGSAEATRTRTRTTLATLATLATRQEASAGATPTHMVHQETQEIPRANLVTVPQASSWRRPAASSRTRVYNRRDRPSALQLEMMISRVETLAAEITETTTKTTTRWSTSGYECTM